MRWASRGRPPIGSCSWTPAVSPRSPPPRSSSAIPGPSVLATSCPRSWRTDASLLPHPPRRRKPSMSLLSSVRRRRTAAVAGLSAAALVALSACSSSASAPSVDGGGASDHLSAYNKIITSAPVASDSEINANAWAKKIKQQGYLKVGGTDSGAIFSIRDLKSGELTGFDAGLSQMLAHYITGKTDVKALTKLSITSVDTRET